MRSPRARTPGLARNWLRMAGAQKLLFQPGKGWCYSNIGYLLVRAFLEEASGMRLGALLHELLFQPLGNQGRLHGGNKG